MWAAHEQGSVRGGLKKLSEKIAGGRQKWLNERLYFPMKEHE
jgi:hypothetical protein